MLELKRYRTHAEILAILTILALAGVNIVDNDEGYLPYGCDKESVADTFAYKLSRVNDDGIQRNAYYDRDNSRKYRVCSTGWYMLKLEEVIKEPEKPVETICPAVRVLAYMPDGTKYWCTEPGPDQECERADDMMANI